MSALPTIRLVAWREIRARLRSRLFVGTTLVLSLVLTAGALASVLLGGSFLRTPVPDAVTVAVVGELTDAQRAALVTAVGGGLEVVDLDDADAAELAVTRGEVTFAVVDAQRILLPPPAGVLGLGSSAALEAADALAVAARLEAAGLTPDQVDDALTVPPLPTDVVGDYDPAAEAGRLVIANLGVVFLFAVLTLYVTLIVNGVIEEKGSRVVELLLEAVPARQLMTGKLLGLGAVGLGQTVVLFGPPLVLLVAVGASWLPTGGLAVGGIVLGWFLLGYAFYAVVAAALGSLVSRPEEAQAVLTPASVTMVVGYLVAFFAINAPDGRTATVAGWLPPTAPYVMLVRQVAGNPTTVEVVGAVAVTVLATVLLTLLAARVYEGGILRVGGRVRLREAWRAAGDG